MTSGLSVRYWDAPRAEVGMIPADQIPDTGPIDIRGGLRWEYQTIRDNRLFEAGWFADFRSKWQHDLALERVRFQARMEAL